ncbi:hypothetical protein [Carboxylicivirga marina]|uniref:Uncharacterized protein n=1 Tax=Carboxylicivirga marina TaxID=2800988 RepID=A0ABS1HIC5_9BACT|nr:hypothetical protein [Carboxylicivirga marina]MBK3517418.1 hypothetical protein [Carboxylicivirga marina]
MKFTFSKVSRHRVFQHDPIYYDEQKEKNEARQRRIKEELGLLEDEEKEKGYADRIRGGMRRRMKSHYEVARSEKRRSNLRLVVILIILMILGVYLIQEGMVWMDSFFAE